MKSFYPWSFRVFSYEKKGCFCIWIFVYLNICEMHARNRLIVVWEVIIRSFWNNIKAGVWYIRGREDDGVTLAGWRYRGSVTLSRRSVHIGYCNRVRESIEGGPRRRGNICKVNIHHSQSGRLIGWLLFRGTRRGGHRRRGEPRRRASSLF